MGKIWTRMYRKQRARRLRERTGNPLARLLRSMWWADLNWEMNGPTRADLVFDPCVYCSGRATSWDHIDAIAKGGTGRYNVVRACRKCNKSKYSTPLLRFLVERAWRARARKNLAA